MARLRHTDKFNLIDLAAAKSTNPKVDGTTEPQNRTEILWTTTGGNHVLECPGETGREFQELTADQAMAWLVVNGHLADVSRQDRTRLEL